MPLAGRRCLVRCPHCHKPIDLADAPVEWDFLTPEERALILSAAGFSTAFAGRVWPDIPEDVREVVFYKVNWRKVLGVQKGGA